MGDTPIEGPGHHGASPLEVVDPTKVVPEPEGDGRQLETAAAAAAVGHRLVAMLRGMVPRSDLLVVLEETPKIGGSQDLRLIGAGPLATAPETPWRSAAWSKGNSYRGDFLSRRSRN